MFKKIFRVWKTDSLLNQALECTEEMFTLVAKNFDNAIEELIENLDEKKARIYLDDQKINECEKDVRRKVLEHLTINPKQDTSYYLILITVVKDLERMGDYVKNIVELAHQYPKTLPRDHYAKDLIDISSRISTTLKDSLNVFRQGDTEKAREYYKFHREVTEKTDSLIIHLLSEKNLEIKEAVVYALFSRYLKRIMAHLANILTTIINPFHLVGYGINQNDNDETEM